MNDPLAWFWTVMIATSIGWYAFLLFYLGIKGGFEIFRMIRVFSGQKHEDAQRESSGS